MSFALDALYQSYDQGFDICYLLVIQAKDRQKKKGGSKGIRIDAEGGASLEDFANAELQDKDYEPPDHDKSKSSSKKVLINST